MSDWRLELVCAFGFQRFLALDPPTLGVCLGLFWGGQSGGCPALIDRKAKCRLQWWRRRGYGGGEEREDVVNFWRVRGKQLSVVAVWFQRANGEGRSVGGGEEPSQRFQDAANQCNILI